jgi:hypothetical protein
MKVSVNVIAELIKRLSYYYNDNNLLTYNSYLFHISGHDSELSSELDGLFTDIFPSSLNNMNPDRNELIRRSDLCLILSRKDLCKLAVFGEVEGVHGEKLRSSHYWGDRLNFCVFGFGVVKGNQKQCYFQDVEVNDLVKICCYFEVSNFVVEDFRKTVQYMKILFLEGPRGCRITSGDEEFDYFVNMLKKYWNKPLVELLDEIARFIDGFDLIGRIHNKPLSLVTNIQAK